jgi:hypothetical protein
MVGKAGVWMMREREQAESDNIRPRRRITRQVSAG